MNDFADFTKEELQRIFDDVSNEISTCKMADNPFMNNLRDKTKRMIDTYCDHDGDIGKDYPAEKCMKCGAMWE